MQESNYYTLGMKVGNSDYMNNDDKYLCNGKAPIEVLHGLECYDYGARMYDAALGRFFTQDAFAEKYLEFSPYQYAANNPIKFIDVNGDSIWINTTEGDLLYQKGKMYSKGDNGELSEYKGEYDKLNKKGKVKGYTGALGTTVNALKTIEKSNFGSAMSNTLQSSKFNFESSLINHFSQPL